MILPNVETAEVSEEKIAGYLLNLQHPDGAGKVRFFLAMGFVRDDWRVLACALRELAARTPIAHQVESRHGVKYVIEGRLETPSGRTPIVRTVWIVDAGAQTPRLVTAYPQEEGD
jgi:hypothetical protein